MENHPPFFRLSLSNSKLTVDIHETKNIIDSIFIYYSVRWNLRGGLECIYEFIQFQNHGCHIIYERVPLKSQLYKGSRQHTTSRIRSTCYRILSIRIVLTREYWRSLRKNNYHHLFHSNLRWNRNHRLHNIFNRYIWTIDKAQKR